MVRKWLYGGIATVAEMTTLDSADDATSQTSWTESMTAANRPPVTLAYYVSVSIFLALSVINLSGNVFTLITIRLTPRLWTKTNYILASMLVSDSLTAINITWMAPVILGVFTRGNPCRYAVANTAVTPVMKATAYVSTMHLNLVCVDRYIAIVHPLHYETKLSERNLKWIIGAIWTIGIVVSATFALWLIDADTSKCVPIPEPYHLLDTLLGYVPVCFSMFFCYGRILLIARRQGRRIDSVPATNLAPGNSTQKTASLSEVQTKQATGSNSKEDPQSKPVGVLAVGFTARPEEPAVASGTSTTSTDAGHQLQREQMKSRKRQFKAVYLTVAIVGSFIVLWFPHELWRVLNSFGYSNNMINVGLVGTAIGSANFAFSWVIYAAASKSYRRAYRQVLIRYGCCGCTKITPPSNSIVVR